MKPVKPLGHKSYGHIPHLSGSRLGPVDHHIEKGQELIATKTTRDWRDLVIVQEKLDGSNCAVAKVNGEILALGRAGYLAKNSIFEMHHLFDWWVKKNRNRFDELLSEGEHVVGEWLAYAHGTRYELPHEPFVVFDIMREHERICYHDFLKRVLPLGFTTPRLIHRGQHSISLNIVLKRLEPSGHGAIDPVEGAVWRVERNGRVDFLCKYVRPDKIDGIYLKMDIWNWWPGCWTKPVMI